MTNQQAGDLLNQTKTRIQELRKGVSWPAKYPEDICHNINQLLIHYKKADLARGLDLARSVIERISRIKTSKKIAPRPDIHFYELPTSFVKEEKANPKIKLDLTVNNVQIRIFE